MLIQGSGNLGTNPKLSITPNDNKVCTFRVSMDTTVRKDKVNHYEGRWYSVSVFGSLAEECHRVLKSGSPVVISGTAGEELWTDNEGKERTTHTILANVVALNVRFVESYQPRKNDRSEDAEG